MYTIIRSPRGLGNECNVVALPINYAASVAAGLTIVKALVDESKQFLIHIVVEPAWQAKDLLVLFYKDTEYSVAIKEFLKDYYRTGF